MLPRVLRSWTCWEEVAAPHGTPLSWRPQPKVAGQEQSCPRILTEGGSATTPRFLTKAIPFFGKSADV